MPFEWRPGGRLTPRVTGTKVIIAAECFIKTVPNVEIAHAKYEAFHRLGQTSLRPRAILLSVD